MVSIQLVFNFPPPLQFFSQGIFSVTLFFSGLCQLPSPSQSKEQGPATTISTHKLCGEGRGRKFSSCFFSSLFQMFSQSIFFSEVLFCGSRALLFFIFIPPPSTMSYVPINNLPAKTYI
jgi:hypothetical protein